MDCPDSSGNVFNVGSQDEISIEDLAKKIIEMTGSKSELQYLSYEQAYGKPFDDMTRRVPCLDRLQKAIGYKPETELDSILFKIIENLT